MKFFVFLTLLLSASFSYGGNCIDLSGTYNCHFPELDIPITVTYDGNLTFNYANSEIIADGFLKEVGGEIDRKYIATCTADKLQMMQNREIIIEGRRGVAFENISFTKDSDGNLLQEAIGGYKYNDNSERIQLTEKSICTTSGP